MWKLFTTFNSFFYTRTHTHTHASCSQLTEDSLVLLLLVKVNIKVALHKYNADELCTQYKQFMWSI